jgi:hypothetical protein
MNDSQQPDRVTVRALVKSAWETAPPVLRTLALWIWSIAFAAMAVLISFDILGWWGDLSFTTNLLSGAISGMIALPIALLVVSRLAAYQVEEANRPRLEARVLTARGRMTEAVRALRHHIETMEGDAAAAADALVQAIRAHPDGDANFGESELAKVNQAARAVRSETDASEWELFQRLIAPVRAHATRLHDALVERSGDSESTDDAMELAKLANELEVAVGTHNSVLSQSQRLFGRRPAVSAYDRRLINELRDAALAYVKSIDRMLGLCRELERYGSGADPYAGVTP